MERTKHGHISKAGDCVSHFSYVQRPELGITIGYYIKHCLSLIFIKINLFPLLNYHTQNNIGHHTNKWTYIFSFKVYGRGRGLSTVIDIRTIFVLKKQIIFSYFCHHSILLVIELIVSVFVLRRVFLHYERQLVLFLPAKSMQYIFFLSF